MGKGGIIIEESIKFLFKEQTPPLSDKQQLLMVYLTNRFCLSIERVLNKQVAPYVNLKERIRLFPPKKKLWGLTSYHTVSQYKTLVDRFITELELSTLNAKSYESQLKDLKTIQSYLKLPKELIVALEQQIDLRATTRAKQSYQRKQEKKTIPMKRANKYSIFLGSDFFPASNTYQQLVQQRKGELSTSGSLSKQLTRIKTEVEVLFASFMLKTDAIKVERTPYTGCLFNLSHLQQQGVGGVGLVISALSELNQAVNQATDWKLKSGKLMVDIYIGKALEQLTQLIPILKNIQDAVDVDDTLEPTLKLQTVFDLTTLNQLWVRDCEKCKLPVFKISTNHAINTYASSVLVEYLLNSSDAAVDDSFLKGLRDVFSDLTNMKKTGLIQFVEMNREEVLNEINQIKELIALPAFEWVKPKTSNPKSSLAFRTLRKLGLNLSIEEIETLALSKEEIVLIQEAVIFQKEPTVLSQKLTTLRPLNAPVLPTSLKLGETLSGTAFTAVELLNVYTTYTGELVWPRTIQNEIKTTLYLKQGDCAIYHWHNQTPGSYLMAFELDEGFDSLIYVVTTQRTDWLDIIKEISKKKEDMLHGRGERAEISH